MRVTMFPTWYMLSYHNKDIDADLIKGFIASEFRAYGYLPTDCRSDGRFYGNNNTGVELCTSF